MGGLFTSYSSLKCREEWVVQIGLIMIGIVFRVYTMYNYIIHTALNLVMLRNVATVDCTCINQYKFKDRKLKTESN